MGNSREEVEESITDLVWQHNKQHIDDDTIDLIQDILSGHSELRKWSAKPRLYTLLCMLRINSEDGTAVFEQADWSLVNDLWLPIDQLTLRALMPTMDWKTFRRFQQFVLSLPGSMSNHSLIAADMPHRNIENANNFFPNRTQIGLGASATVYRILPRRSDQVFACKSYARGTFRDQTSNFSLFDQEKDILRKLNHSHIVSLVASYTDLSSFALILLPAAQISLEDTLRTASCPVTEPELSILRQSFGCLMSATDYLHSKNIRHKDIKPSNILLDNGQVFLCDFGISYDWTGKGPTTDGRPNGLSRGYCAPEVVEYEPRDCSADIWSMGRVFCDLITVLRGRSLGDLVTSIGGSLTSIYEDGGLQKLQLWLSGLVSDTEGYMEDSPLEWIRRMMAEDPRKRPEAHQILEEIRQTSIVALRPYVASCCSTAGTVAAVARTVPAIAENLNAEPVAVIPDSAPGIVSVDTVIRSDASSTDILELRPDTRQDSPIPQPLHVPILSDKIYLPPPSDHPHAPRQSFGAVSYSTGQHTSNGSSISALQPRVRCSSGSRSVAVPTPVQLTHVCNCQLSTSVHGRQEQHLLNLPIAAANIMGAQSNSEQWTRCGLSENAVQIYESYLGEHIDQTDIWLKTRRLVLSHKPGTSMGRCCASFWLPLADHRFTYQGPVVTLQWSDCNHWKQYSDGYHDRYFDRVYDKQELNHKIKITFLDPQAAAVFVDTLRVVCAAVRSTYQWQRTEIVGMQDLYITEPYNQAGAHYRAASLTTYDTQSLRTQLFVHFLDIDLELSHQYDQTKLEWMTTVKFNKVMTPAYISNIRGQVSDDSDEVAQCFGAKLKISGYQLHFPLEPSTASSMLTNGLKQTLKNLTGWVICFYAPNVEIKKPRYGHADMMLWKRANEVVGLSDLEAKVTFRHRKTDNRCVWMSGAIITTKGTSLKLYPDRAQAKITIYDTIVGFPLNTSSMTAIPREEKHGRLPKSTTGERLHLQFANLQDYRTFSRVFPDLQAVGDRDDQPLTPTVTPTTLTRPLNESPRFSFRFRRSRTSIDRGSFNN